MPTLITEDYVDALQFERINPADREVRLRERAARFVAWATDDRYELEEGLTGAYLLTSAAQHLLSLGDLDEVERLADVIDARPDADEFAADVLRMEVRLRRGDRDGAIALADEVRRERPADPMIAEQIGELFEEFDELQIAERWFTMGVRMAEASDASDFGYSIMLTARYRVRRTAGKPEDGLDVEAMEVRAALGLGRPRGLDEFDLDGLDG